MKTPTPKDQTAKELKIWKILTEHMSYKISTEEAIAKLLKLTGGKNNVQS